MKKRISAFIAAGTVFVLSFSFFAFAARPEAGQALRLVDKAKLIEKADEEAFLEKLDTISEELQFDFVVATVKTTGGKDIQTFTDDYFDENGFGYDSSHNGVALVISMNPRAVYIGVENFIDQATTYVDYGREGYSEMPTVSKTEAFLINWKTSILAPVAIGIILAFITVAIMTKGLMSLSKILICFLLFAMSFFRYMPNARYNIKLKRQPFI